MTFHERQKLFIFFFQDISRKFLILLLSYFFIFLTANIIFICYFFSLIIMAFPACTCEPVHIQHSFVCKSGSKVICTLQHGFLCFLLFLYLYCYYLLCIITHLCFLFPQRVPPDLEGGYEKSILTRTETLFYHYLFQRTRLIITLFLKTICFYLPFISIRI